jgi:hypothetical protein
MRRRLGHRTATLLLALACALSAGVSRAQEQSDVPFPFRKGRVRLSIFGSTTGSSDNRYFVLGAGVGYFLADGFEVGFEGETWLFGDPFVGKVSPQIRYIVPYIPMVHPYFGTFYRHWFVSGEADVDTIGGRTGLVLVTGTNIFVGGGVVHEVIISECDEDCSETYPEFVVAISF